jgi:hypothetical protein
MNLRNTIVNCIPWLREKLIHVDQSQKNKEKKSECGLLIN